MTNFIAEKIRGSIDVKLKMLENPEFLKKIETAANLMAETFQADGKVLFCGNGGSAADAQHLAAELSGRFYKDRKPLFAEALSVNSSFVTAVANDYGYDEVFARMTEAAGRPGDVLVAISTSGNSISVLNAIKSAKFREMKIVGMTGQTGGKMAALCDVLLNVPSNDTPRIQESHILIGHILCEIVENQLFTNEKPSIHPTV